MPGWCRVSANREVLSKVAPDFQRSVTLDCVRHSTSRPSLPLGAAHSFKPGLKGLLKRGKSKMSVICAVMRKLIHLVYGVLKTGKEFDPQWAKSA